MTGNIPSFIHFISSAGISITFFLIFLLIKRKDNHRANYLLAGLLFCFLSLFVAYASLTAALNSLAMQVMAFALSTPFAMGPLLHFYVDTIYQDRQVSRIRFLKHFAPFLSALVLFTFPTSVIAWTGGPASLEGIPLYLFIIPILGIVTVSIYLWSLFIKLNRYESQVRDNYASLDTRDLSWLKQWLKGILLFIVLDITLSMLSVIFEELQELIFLNVAYLFGLIVYVGYSGIQQTPVFLSAFNPTKNQSRSKKKAPGFPPEPPESDLGKALIFLFEKEQIHLNENLALNDVAEALDESPKKITEVLNGQLNTNFYGLVNQYRVDTFKRQLLLEESKGKTFLGLAYESGFKSKATFNRAFKEITGLTPKAYQSTLK